MNIDELRKMVGREVAVSGWMEIDQHRIDRFAEATGDRQWIHVDPVRAAGESPYGATVAHGFLTLSLLSALFQDAVPVREGIRFAINYGLNRVRFPGAVPAGSRIRGRFVLRSLDTMPDGSVQAVWEAVVEREGESKPACAAEWLTRYYI